MIRLYDSGFRLVAPPKSGASGDQPSGDRLQPHGAKLAVGYYDVAAVDLFDGQSLELVRGPNLDGLVSGGLGLATVAWSVDGSVLFAGGVIMKQVGVPFWPGPAEGGGSSDARCRPGITIRSWASRPCQMVPSWSRRRIPFWRFWRLTAAFAGRTSSPTADFRDQYKTLATIGGRRDCRFRL